MIKLITNKITTQMLSLLQRRHRQSYL
jgi:hypothetical protein